MATMYSKRKRFRYFPFVVLVWIFLLFLTMINYLNLTINYTKLLHNEFKNVTITLENPRKPEWFDLIIREIKDIEKIKIGLVNTDEDFVISTEIVISRANRITVQFDHADENLVEWHDLFPERINETLPECPNIPMPNFDDYEELDVVVAKTNWYGEKCHTKDISKLQINLIVANLVARRGRGNDRPIFVVFIGSCPPMWEIFSCDELLWNEGNTWVYKPNLRKMKQKLLMPIGSCEFVPPVLQIRENSMWRNGVYNELHRQREAYVSILHSSEDYICGAIVLAQSIIQSNSTKDLVLLVDENISIRSLDGLRLAGWKVKRIQRIRSPFSTKGSYNEWNYSKLRIWQLVEYDKVMFIDSDLIVKKNMDEFFIYPQLTAAGNYQRHLFNSGLMIVEPSECTFKTLMNKRLVVESYNGGDQGFLNEMFSWWHRLPAKLNYLKVFVDLKDKTHEIPDDVYAIHYTGLKPWKCLKTYDCNWDESGRYASNSAHKQWWHVYNAMPQHLKECCASTLSVL